MRKAGEKYTKNKTINTCRFRTLLSVIPTEGSQTPHTVPEPRTVPSVSSTLNPGAPSAALGRSRARTLDGKEGGPFTVTVLEAALDAPSVAELHVVDYHLRDEVTALLVAGRGEAVTGDDGLLGRDAQDHGAIQSPHDEPPTLRDGAVEVGLLARQHRGVLGSFYDLVAGSGS